MRRIPLPLLLGFNGGFVDTIGFLGLQGLFTTHVTGNFVTLAAALVLDLPGVLTKMLAIPLFIVVVALARIAGNHLADSGRAPMTVLLGVQFVLLCVFFGLAVWLGPFPNSDTPAALVTGLSGVAAMAIQNAVQRIHLASEPPTTILTGTTTQFAIDLADWASGRSSLASPEARRKFLGLARAIVAFGCGAMSAAAAFHFVGMAGLAIALVVAALVAWSEARPTPESGMLM